MGQQEVYDFFQKNRKRWFDSRQIAKNLKLSIGSVTNCLKKLRENNALNFKYLKTSKSKRNVYFYKYKR